MSTPVVPIRPGIQVDDADPNKPSLALGRQIEHQRRRLLEGLSVLIVLRKGMEECADNAIYCDTLKAAIAIVDEVAGELNGVSGDPPMVEEDAS